MQRGWLPLRVACGVLELAVADPSDEEAFDKLGHRAGLLVEPLMASPTALEVAIRSAYAMGEPSGTLEGADGVSETSPSAELPSTESSRESGDGPIEHYVRELVATAVARRASDIHLEPMEERFRIRLRVDGRLQEVASPPTQLQAAIVSRVKLMAGISIAEKRLPQDGRIRMAVQGNEYDLRVSSINSLHGETVVMRVLQREGVRLGIDLLGLSDQDRMAFQRMIELPNGILLVTGPTGSGKSTTLYTALHHLNQPGRKLITVEDPVEQRLQGVNQVQVHREVGMTFGAALRAVLRQAPNIIMVGEIRDLETAEVAINAALTGHLVFSTLHTNDAVSAIPRLIDMGVKPFLLADTLRGVLAQRLVRKICEACAETFSPPESLLVELAGLDPASTDSTAYRRGRGCERCAGRGFHGRIGIFELLCIDEPLRALVAEGVGLASLREHARAGGMRTLRHDSLEKVAAGMTTLEEAVAVTVGDPPGPDSSSRIMYN